MSTKRIECCWCGDYLQPEIKHYWGRTKDKMCKDFIYPDLCPKCQKRPEIRAKFKTV